MAVFIIAMPNGANTALTAQVPELEDSGRQCDLTGYNLVNRILTLGREYVLFWPTVGAILSGERPGVSLYKVFIFSSNV